MALDVAKNFAKATVSTGYDASATSIVVTGGHGLKFPTVPFNVVWWNSTDYADPSDDPNVEIVRVTNISTDTLTVTRAQESTSASTKNDVGKTYKMIAGLTADKVNNIAGGSDTQLQRNDAGKLFGDANLVMDKTTSRVNIGQGSIVTTAQLIIKALTGAEYNLMLEGTGGVIIPTIGFKHVSDSTGVRVTGDDTGFNFSNIGEGTTIFVKPGYPDAYWKTHGSLAAIFHLQSHDGSSYLDSHVVKGGLNAFGHASPDRLMHPEIADAVTDAVSYIQRLTHVSSGTTAIGFGIGEEIELENASGTNKIVKTEEVTYSDPTNASEDVNYIMKLMIAGALKTVVDITGGVVRLGSGQTLFRATALANEPPASAFATFDTRNAHAVLDFDATTDEEAVFRGIMPLTYNGGGITIKLHFMATSATSGNAVWQAAFEALLAQDADSDGFAAFQSSGQVAVSGTSGIASIATITFTDGSQMDSVAAGGMFRLKIRRDADNTSATDDATGDLEFIALEMRET